MIEVLGALAAIATLVGGGIKLYKWWRQRYEPQTSLVFDLRSLQNALDGFLSRRLEPGTIQGACRVVSSAGERVCVHRSALARLGDEKIHQEVDFICRAVQELENLCDLGFRPEGSFQERVLVAKGLARGLGEKIDKLRDVIPSQN